MPNAEMLELADKLVTIFDRIGVSCDWRLSSEERQDIAKAAVALHAAAPPPIETAEQWSARWQKAKEEMANLPAGADAVREALKPFAAVAEYDIGETEADADIYRPMSKNNRAPLLTVGDLRRAYVALFPTPQQEKPTGDQT